MAQSKTSKVLELFGKSTRTPHVWDRLVAQQACPFANTRCFKVRKSNPDISIGTCSVRYGRECQNVIICPNRMLERRQVFTDCLHLLTQHTPGNELHIIPEVSIPGGSVDYFLASARKGQIKDFVAIEFQTLDTTGTVWSERQRLLRELGLRVSDKDARNDKSFGMNWKMTAKTILVQLHHKVDTLEHVNKRFVLVIQDCLLSYLRREFNFGHIQDVRVGDTMHLHAYKLDEGNGEFRIELAERISTDAAGVATALGIQTDTRIELEAIVAELERKISAKTRFTVGTAIPPAEVMPTE